MITEFLVPYLLFAQYSFNDPDVYYGPQYVFNYSRNWEGDSGYQFNYLATVKCQNSNTTSLICAMENVHSQIYTENKHGQQLKIPDTFKIDFNENGIKQVKISKNAQREFSDYCLQEAADLLNIQWINKINSENGLVQLQEPYISDKCNSEVKVMKLKENEHDIENKNLFTIDKVGNFNGMKFNYKKTIDSKKCFNKKDVAQIFISHHYLVHRVIMSAHEFISFQVKRSLSMKISIVLTMIEPAKNKIIFDDSD